MEKELTEVYCGNGKGKTALAIGQSLRVATQGKSVIVIQFLKGRDQRSLRKERMLLRRPDRRRKGRGEIQHSERTEFCP